jgi:hypothetical protein
MSYRVSDGDNVDIVNEGITIHVGMGDGTTTDDSSRILGRHIPVSFLGKNRGP